MPLRTSADAAKFGALAMNCLKPKKLFELFSFFDEHEVLLGKRSIFKAAGRALAVEQRSRTLNIVPDQHRTCR